MKHDFLSNIYGATKQRYNKKIASLDVMDILVHFGNVTIVCFLAPSL